MISGSEYGAFRTIAQTSLCFLFGAPLLILPPKEMFCQSYPYFRIFQLIFFKPLRKDIIPTDRRIQRNRHFSFKGLFRNFGFICGNQEPDGAVAK